MSWNSVHAHASRRGNELEYRSSPVASPMTVKKPLPPCEQCSLHGGRYINLIASVRPSSSQLEEEEEETDARRGVRSHPTGHEIPHVNSCWFLHAVLTLCCHAVWMQSRLFTLLPSWGWVMVRSKQTAGLYSVRLAGLQRLWVSSLDFILSLLALARDRRALSNSRVMASSFGWCQWKIRSLAWEVGEFKAGLGNADPFKFSCVLVQNHVSSSSLSLFSAMTYDPFHQLQFYLILLLIFKLILSFFVTWGSSALYVSRLIPRQVPTKNYLFQNLSEGGVCIFTACMPHRASSTVCLHAWRSYVEKSWGLEEFAGCLRRGRNCRHSDQRGNVLCMKLMWKKL